MPRWGCRARRTTPKLWPRGRRPFKGRSHDRGVAPGHGPRCARGQVMLLDARGTGRPCCGASLSRWWILSINSGSTSPLGAPGNGAGAVPTPGSARERPPPSHPSGHLRSPGAGHPQAGHPAGAPWGGCRLCDGLRPARAGDREPWGPCGVPSACPGPRRSSSRSYPRVTASAQ